jgi:Na+-translocating ferredoxin:NAD+ oxidoreductase RnfE subunit
MNENLHKSLFLNSPAVILGLGLVAPLLVLKSPIEHLLLGAVTTGALLAITTVISLFNQQLRHNTRSAVAVLLTGGILSLAATVSGSLRLPARLPVETIAPILLIVSLLALHTEAYAVKKRLQPVLLDAAGTGISFMALLTLCGICRDLLGGTLKGGFQLLSTMSSLRFFLTAPGMFLIAGLAVFLIALVTRRKNRETV